MKTLRIDIPDTVKDLEKVKYQIRNVAGSSWIYPAITKGIVAIQVLEDENQELREKLEIADAEIFDLNCEKKEMHSDVCKSEICMQIANKMHDIGLNDEQKKALEEIINPFLPF